MSRAQATRGAGVIAALALAVGLLFGGIGMSRANPPAAADREIVLAARDMAYFLPGDPRPNPTLEVARGETVRVVLINEDAGMEHDFAIPALGTASRLVDGRGTTAVTFRAPSRRGDHEYYCTLHAVVMRGMIAVR